MHCARWMGLVQYAIRMILFHTQFKMTEKYNIGMKIFARFAVIFYARNWFAEPSAPRAPRTDIEYLQRLQNYEYEQVAAVAAKALCRRLWYLNEELVPFIFLDDGVSNDMKLQMIQALKKPAIAISIDRIVIDYKDKTVSELT